MNGQDAMAANSEHFLRLRVEVQGAESRSFRSYLGRRNQVPGAEDRVDYFMMRRKRAAYYLNDEDEDGFDEERKFAGINPSMRESASKKLNRLASSIAKVSSSEIRESI